ncbi:MAG: AAA family ATPase [Alphaproteobacteria bacterium]|nr:AAA family ATPase [Alphaproteobacteria bacterium]
MQATATKQMANLENIRGAIAAKIDAAAFTSWISPLKFDICDGVLCLSAQNQFSADYINGVYSGVLGDVVAEFGLGVKITVAGASHMTAPVANDNAAQSYCPAPVKNENIAFDAFVESDENAFVVSACRRVAAGPVSFSPLFIYGPAGCGKTLLANCINSAATGRTIMMTGAGFVAEFSRSLATRNIFAFKDFCRNCDTFILDDVTALAGKRATMDEFMQLVVDLRVAGKNIVLTSNVSPNNLNGFDRRFQSLLASGLVADMAAPNATVCRTILMRNGVARDVAEFISMRTPADGHAISGIANKIATYSELMNADVTIDVATRLLGDTLKRVRTPIAMVRDMCEKLGVSYDAVCGAGRSRAIVLARQIMMVVLKRATNMSLTEIGNMVGGRDHATVLYAIRQIDKMIGCDLVLAAQINQLVAECHG